jgi:hypothetical protein
LIASGRVKARGVIMVLSLYDLARCHMAIEAVERRDKPVAEIPVAIPVAQLGQLIDDVQHVVETTETGEIRVHVDYREGVALVAFYRYEWCRAALRFLKGGGVPPPALPWMEGLIFGYNPSAIQRFIETTACSESGSTSPRRTSGTEETPHAC